MKTNTFFLVTLFALSVNTTNAQTPLVGSGSSYNNIFSPAANATLDLTGGLVTIELSNATEGPISAGVWDLSAQGGAKLSLVESGAQTALTGTSLQFNINNSAIPLLGSLAGSSIRYAWTAEARFDTSGTLNYNPNTMYNISFNVDGNNGLLDSVLGLTPQFSFDLIDGSGNSLISGGSSTLVDIAGLLGSGVTSGTVNINYTTGGSAPTGPIGIRFQGEALVGSAALGIGTNFATVSNLNISATPVPEPGSCILISSVGIFLTLRRKRGIPAL